MVFARVAEATLLLLLRRGRIASFTVAARDGVHSHAGLPWLTAQQQKTLQLLKHLRSNTRPRPGMGKQKRT